MKKIVIIQARMGSTRLPSKVMAEIETKPMLEHIVERVKRCREIDEIVVATTDSVQDDIIESLCARMGVSCFRGSEKNVLERFYGAASMVSADVITRITADCPLICPYMIDRHIGIFQAGNFDCVSPRSKEGLIRGLDNETFSFNALERARNETESDEEREHVTLHFYNNPDKYKIFSPKVDDIYKENVRFCVDEVQDLKLIKAVYAKLYKPESIINTIDAIKFVKNEPKLAEINLNVRQVSFDSKDRR